MVAAPQASKPPTKRTRARAEASTATRVLRVRIKDKHSAVLEQLAREVNFVWNYCNDLAIKVFQRERRFIKASEMQRYLAGASKEGLACGSAIFQEIAEVYCKSRAQHRKVKLAWRASRGARRALGWIPFKDRAIRYRDGQLHFNGLKLSLWDSWGLAGYELRAGSISQDARGRWYANLSVRIPRAERAAPQTAQAIGIDLGLKDLAALSDGRKVDNQRFYAGLQDALARAQRAGKKQRVKAIHAKVASRRRDYLHKLTTGLVREHGVVCVGDVNARALARGLHGKAVLDAGWSAMRAMLRYKCDDAAAWFIEVPEAGTTRQCSCCGASGEISSAPAGVQGLAVRSWVCAVCGASHDRDTNAARNILARGLAMLEEQFSAAGEAKAREAAANEAGASTPAGAGHGPRDAGILAL